MSAMIDIGIIAFLVVGFSNLIQHKFGNRLEVQQMQKDMKVKQKRLNEMMKESEGKLSEDGEVLQKEIMAGASKSLKMSMRASVISMFVILPVFWWLGDTYETATVIVPLLGNIGWFWWYFIVAIIGSLVMNKVMSKVFAKK